jgi:hypothetical protein
MHAKQSKVLGEIGFCPMKRPACPWRNATRNNARADMCITMIADRKAAAIHTGSGQSFCQT